MRAALFLGLALAGSSAAQTTAVTERDYWQTVSRYASGDRSAALEATATWTERDLRPILKSVQDLEKTARRCRGCEERARFDALPLRAALLLHAERDIADRLAKSGIAGGLSVCRLSPEGHMAEGLLGPVAAQPGGLPFATRFTAAFSLHLRSALCFLTSRDWAETGLKLAPGDAVLRFNDGLASETIGVTEAVEPSRRGFRDARGRQISGYGEVNVKKELNRALADFEQALALDPRMLGARVRLGRVQWKLGRGLEARATLSRAVTEAEGVELYLARLFLGQCLEDEGDLDGALEQYAASLILRPDAQAGAVALAHAQSLRGQPEQAREILEHGLAWSGRRQTADPYWEYLIGSAESAEALIEGLRRETAR